MDKIKNNYTYSSLNTFYYPNTDMKIYEFKDLTFLNNINNQTKIIKSLCFLISIDMNHSHGLLDGIGAYYQLKQIYPEIIPIFIIQENKKIKFKRNINLVLKEFAEVNNYQIINLNDYNYSFKNAVINSCYPSVVDISKIESADIFAEKNVLVGINFYKQSLVEILNNINLPYNKSNRKIYISRKSTNKNRLMSDDQYIVNKLSYNPNYDEKIEKLMMENGYEIIDLDGYNLSDHINLFSQCSKIVSIEGTGLINKIFAPKTCSVLSIRLVDIDVIWYELLQPYDENNILLCDLLNLSIEDGIQKISNYLKIL